MFFKRGRRWQPAFYPFKKETIPRRLLAFIERKFKGILFDCRMCGNCLLQETAFICPMQCPKGLRNGPCGGCTKEYCYVDKTQPCVWYEIFKKAQKMKREELLLEILPPLDWDKVGTETWGEVVLKIRDVGISKFFSALLFSKNQEKKTTNWNNVFKVIRQPKWWNGDSEYHAPAYTEHVSKLEKYLRDGKFVVTAEILTPKTASTKRLIKDIELIKPYAVAMNYTDSPSATPSMSSIACSKVTIDCGVEPVLQITGRDASRTALQSQVIGASAIGVRNILCLTGDSVIQGPSPRGNMGYYDLDAVQMIWILRKMRDEGKYLSGKEIKYPPKYFIGACATLFTSAPKIQAIREHKKINAGAQFFQTNLSYNINGLENWINELEKRGIRDKVYILAGVTPLRSYKMAQYIHNELPGVIIPDNYLKRMEKAGDKAEEEGIAIAIEIINDIKSRNIVNGIHIMAIGWESIIPRIIKETYLADNLT